MFLEDVHSLWQLFRGREVQKSFKEKIVLMFKQGEGAKIAV